MNFIWYILIGIIAGYVAGKITRGGGFGLLVNLVLGIIGGVLGGWVFSLLGLAATGIIGSFAIGALVYHFSRTAKAKKLKNDVFNALREIEADAETAMEDAKAKAVKAGVKVAGKVADKANDVKEKLSEVGQ